jgi:WxL interacting protein linking bacterial and host surfaces
MSRVEINRTNEDSEIRMTVSPRPFRLLLRALLAVGALLALTGPTSAPAHASDNGSWAVTPTPPAASSAAPRSYFVLEAEPGAKIKDSLRIQNLTGKPITFTIYGADGFNTAQDGFFALKGAEEAQIDVGSWIKLPVTKVELAGRTQVDVPFTLTVPKNATPGDHIGGVVAMNNAVEGTDDSSGVNIGIQRAVGARLYLRVAGPTTPGLAVSDVHLEADRGAMPWTGSGSGTVTYTVTNTGNVRLSPTATVTVSGAGHEVDTVEEGALVDLLPGQQVNLSSTVEGIRWFDRLTTEVVVTSPEGATARDSDTVWLTPWSGIALGLLLLLGLGALVVRRRSALRRRMQAAEQAPVISVPVGK